MTEEEVLERFDKYGNAIRTLKQKLVGLENIKSALDIAVSDSHSDNEALQRENSELKTGQDVFRDKTYKTIKHLVEDIIEPMEKEINTPKRGDVQALGEVAKLKEEILALNNTLTTLNSEKERLDLENISLKEQIEEKDTTILRMTNEIGVKDTELTQIKGELSKLKEELTPKVIKRNGAETFPYKFANLQKETMSRVLDFVDCLFENVEEKDGTMILSDVFKAAQKANLSDKELEVFTRRFNEMKVNGFPVIGFDNNIAHSTFKPDWIKQYISTLTR